YDRRGVAVVVVPDIAEPPPHGLTPRHGLVVASTTTAHHRTRQLCRLGRASHHAPALTRRSFCGTHRNTGERSPPMASVAGRKGLGAVSARHPAVSDDAVSATTPRVSVVMPVFDAGRPLEQALDSVAVQTFTDRELVIVDDGSRDPTTLALLDAAAV